MSEKATSPRRILVVDDNKDSAESLALLLQLQGHLVRTAHDGHTCLQITQTHRPHLIFLDIGMPGMSGYEVAEELRKVPGLREVPLVALTGRGSEEDVKRSEEAGFATHLVKPIDPEALSTLIAQFS